MPTFIPHSSKLVYEGSVFKYRRFKPAHIPLLALCILAFLLTPENASSEYSVKPPTATIKKVSRTEVVQYIKSVNKDLADDDAKNFAGYAVDAAQTFNLDIALLLALIRVESGFKPDISSSMGAMGLTQVVPKWHKAKIEESRKLLQAYSIYEPKLNIYVGAWALREFIDSSAHDVHIGLLKYNGSLSDPTRYYANAVMNEAYAVRTKFLKL